MPNLETELTKTEIKSLLGLNAIEANAKLDICFSMAVEQTLREFKSSIGKRLVRNITMRYQAAVEGESDEMLYIVLPEDVRSVDSLYYGATRINLLDVEDYVRWIKSEIEIVNPFVGLQEQLEDGTKIISFYPKSSGANGGYVDLIYNVNGKDLSVFPDQYKRLIFYGAAKEYLLFDTIKRDPAIHNKIKSEWKDALLELTGDQIYASGNTVDRKTMEEQRWEDSFSDFGNTPSRDLRSH
jgi:hypothetical protein